MSIKSLQTKVGVKADGELGPVTVRKVMEYFKLTPIRTAHFLGQTAHETGGFTLFTENLNYSAAGLLSIFPRHFTQQQAQEYQRKPERIANRAYRDRMGNGNEASGDGWKFRGRGALQLTGKDNYKLFSEYLKRPEIMTNPDLVTAEFAFESAMFFFDRNKLWTICDGGVDDKTITAVTRRVNGGTHGLQDRIQRTKRFYEFVK
jgi:putative chitinase